MVEAEGTEVVAGHWVPSVAAGEAADLVERRAESAQAVGNPLAVGRIGQAEGMVGPWLEQVA